MTFEMKKKTFILCLFIAQLFFVSPIFAQDSTNFAKDSSVLNNPPPEPQESTTKIVTPLSRLEFTLSLTVLGFGLLVILLEIFLIRTNKISSEDTIKFIIITLIITSTLFLITAGYSNDQIAPAVGLLGTIAGYLLGRIQSSNQKENKNETSS
jgi:asparagine N-glycosylation enzyme membrane subunit Stt3